MIGASVILMRFLRGEAEQKWVDWQIGMTQQAQKDVLNVVWVVDGEIHLQLRRVIDTVEQGDLIVELIVFQLSGVHIERQKKYPELELM